MNFKEKIKQHQIEFFQQRGEILTSAQYPYILQKGEENKNLYEDIRTNVSQYFQDNQIAFWGGKTITPNTLSSQVACLNHLFLIRNKEEETKRVMQSFVGDKFEINSMEKVHSEKKVSHCAYIAFEMVSDQNRMNEGCLTRGNTCTSIDALAIAKGKDGKRYLLVIEWKLVEDDSGNKAPSQSMNKKAIDSGKTRVKNYGKLIEESQYIKCCTNYYDSSLFHLPFYELMRQTLWAERNKKDFQADDYYHIHVLPSGNPMRTKKYACCNKIKGVENGWRSLLTPEGDERYIVANPHQVVETLSQSTDKGIRMLVDYLQKRYYDL